MNNRLTTVVAIKIVPSQGIYSTVKKVQRLGSHIPIGPVVTEVFLGQRINIDLQHENAVSILQKFNIELAHQLVYN